MERHTRGRPRGNTLRHKVISVRLTEQEYERVRTLVAGVSLSSYVRKQLLKAGARRKRIDPAELETSVRYLAEMVLLMQMDRNFPTSARLHKAVDRLNDVQLAILRTLDGDR